MNSKKGLLGLFLLVALLVSACGPTTPTPEAAMQEGDSGLAAAGGDAMNMEDQTSSADTMSGETMVEGAGDAGGMEEEGQHDGTASADDTEAMMKDDPSESMTGEETAEKAMKMDDSGEMATDDNTMASDDAMKDDAMKDDGMKDDGMKDDAMQDDAMMDLPAWFSAELTDVGSGQVLTVADLQGKVVLVETMAIWCTNCLRQQQEVKALHEELGERDDLVTLVLDIDPNEDAENLEQYAAKNGFHWTYVVAPREVAREIGQLYGDQFLNPPSTPMLIVDRHGEVHLLPFGRKTGDDLQEALAPFLNEGM